jgi:hypothetical protein
MLLKERHLTNILVIFVLALTLACALASPFDKLMAGVVESTPQITRTLQPTFTATRPATPTPIKTSTPTLTPIPTDTPTPPPTPTLPPTDTPTPTETSTPAPPPPPTNTPLPTDTPAPTWDYQLSELYNQPTEATILSIMVAVQGHDGGWIPGLRVVGVDPNGVVTKSEPTADGVTGYTPPGDVVKSGNTKFEPISGYVTGTWYFHLETHDGTQVSDTYPVNMDAENRSWYFFRFQPG